MCIWKSVNVLSVHMQINWRYVQLRALKHKNQHLLRTIILKHLSDESFLSGESKDEFPTPSVLASAPERSTADTATIKISILEDGIKGNLG